MFYNDELKTKEDYILLLQEIEAYRELESQEFNFNGIILRNDSEYNLGSEDAYYEMDIQNLEDILDYWDDEFNGNICNTCRNDKIKDNKGNCRLNRYDKKLINKNKLKKLSKYNESIYYHEDEDWYERCYLSNIRSYDKYCSKKIRHRNDFALKGNSYRKVYYPLKSIR